MPDAAQSEILAKYTSDVSRLRELSRRQHLTDTEINEVFEESFSLLKTSRLNGARPESGRFHAARFALWTFGLIAFGVFLYVLTTHHQPTLSLFMRNVQNLIYPSLKVWRLLAVPILRWFPSLTALYDEACLVENPYFFVSDIDCWPCENVFVVQNFTNVKNLNSGQYDVPFIAKTDQKPVTFHDLNATYQTHSSIFIEHAPYVTSNGKHTLISEIFAKTREDNRTNLHVSWRLNRMEVTRPIRKLFPKPQLLSKWASPSVERYVIVDGVGSGAYTLPDLDCSFVCVTQGYGERVIVLEPTRACIGQCRQMTVNLKPAYILFYNWWYWKPISLPATNATTHSISYITSYCDLQ